MVPQHCNNESIAIKPVVISVGGGSCLQFIKIATFVKHNKVKSNKARDACILKFFGKISNKCRDIHLNILMHICIYFR